MSRTILTNQRNIRGFDCENGDCIWLEADDVDVVYKEMNATCEEGKVTIKLKNGFAYTMHYVGTNTDEVEAEFRRYIKQIEDHRTDTTKTTNT